MATGRAIRREVDSRARYTAVSSLLSLSVFFLCFVCASFLFSFFLSTCNGRKKEKNTVGEAPAALSSSFAFIVFNVMAPLVASFVLALRS